MITDDEHPFACPLLWCKAEPDAHDPENPLVGEHLLPILSNQPFGDVEVLRTYEGHEHGTVVVRPAVVSQWLFATTNYTPRDSQILAKALELAALVAEGINAGEWE
jgi:hypothetical protein